MPVRASLNAVVRFSVYLSVLLLLTSRDAWYLLLVPVVMTATVLLESVFPEAKTIIGEKFASGPVVSGYTGTETSMPTADNPFMNPQLTDIIDNPERPPAAEITDVKVRDKVNQAFAQTSNIYMDTTDLFDQTQAMRTFHTLQSARVPNDQDGFLAWLAMGYDDPDTSAAFPSRGGKILSEGYANARGAMRNLDNTTCKPAGTAPLSTPDSAPARSATAQ